MCPSGQKRPYLGGGQANGGKKVQLDKVYLVRGRGRCKEEWGKFRMLKLRIKMKFSLRKKKRGNTWHKKF